MCVCRCDGDNGDFFKFCNLYLNSRVGSVVVMVWTISLFSNMDSLVGGVMVCDAESRDAKCVGA